MKKLKKPDRKQQISDVLKFRTMVEGKEKRKEVKNQNKTKKFLMENLSKQNEEIVDGKLRV